ncbi:MAG: PhzF family phenazine biosynthesis protein [Nitrososphaerales archaeon]
MLILRLYQIDAFTRQVFGGNPAAVCPLEAWPDDGTLQAIASENNLSETAFFSPEGGPGGRSFRLRWFAPRKEVSLCGHATLASAFVLFNELGYREEVVRFETMSGELRVRRDGELLGMDFPAKQLEPALDRAAALLDALHVAPSQVFAVVPGRTLVAVYEDEETVRLIRPDFNRLAELSGPVAITAPGRDSDCASRFFYPAAGLPEDPVTGSVHCSLVPYWAARLGKKSIHARQVSPRGGELFCEDLGERVIIAGHAVKYMEGTTALPVACSVPTAPRGPNTG